MGVLCYDEVWWVCGVIMECHWCVVLYWSVIGVWGNNGV